MIVSSTRHAALSQWRLAVDRLADSRAFSARMGRHRMVIIFNPVAGRRRAALLWRVLDVLAANGIRLDLAETHRAGHAEALAREAARGGASMVVAAGGDGTIAEVANGLMGSGARLGVIPLGTANVLAHELALPFAPRAVAAALAFGRTRTLWPGVARGPDSARLFVQRLGETWRYQFPPIRLRIDSMEIEAASAVISKGRLYGGRFLLAPESRPAEPGFSVILFGCGGPAAALMYGAALPMGFLGRAPGVRHVRAHRVDMVGNAPIPAQADGDAAGFTPLSVTDAPGPIEVVTGYYQA